MIDPSAFEPDRSCDLTDDVPGVDGRLLADLYDCAAKFGRPHRSPQMRVLDTDTPKPLHVSVVIDPPGNHNMMVSRTPYGFSRGRVKTMILSDPLPSGVAWDGDVTPEEVRALIDATDRAMRERGGCFNADGSRIAVTDGDASPTKLRVDRVFTAPGTVVIIPEGSTSREVRAAFDRPDELHLVMLSNGLMGFVHTKDRLMVKRADAFAATMVRWGLPDAEAVGRLSEARFKRFCAEAMAAMYAADN